jgi:D-galactose 1-dehydrogenase
MKGNAAMPIRIAVVGLGQIARGQHLPAIADSPHFELAATASPGERLDGVPGYDSLADLLQADHGLQAVAMCQPTQPRYADTRRALEAGLHVLLEKPPAVTIGEVRAMADLARSRGLTLQASWHSRHAPGVEPTRRWLAGRRIRAAEIVWKEDVRQYHPGAEWIWGPGGLGIFGSAINAFSILTHVAPAPVFLTGAVLAYPAGRAQPITADLAFSDPSGAAITGTFDWSHSGPSIWEMRFETDAGPVALTQHAGALSLAGVDHPLPPQAQYRDLYRHFAALIASGASDVDEAPMQLVADAYLCGERRLVAPFED